MGRISWCIAFGACLLFLAAKLVRATSSIDTPAFFLGDLDARTKNCSLRIAMARTGKQRAQGVSAWGKFASGRGLLFKSRSKKKDSFWNRGVGFPVTVLFLDGTGLVRDVHLLAPESRAKVSSETSFTAALELSPETVDRCGIRVGTRVQGLGRELGI